MDPQGQLICYLDDGTTSLAKISNVIHHQEEYKQDQFCICQCSKSIIISIDKENAASFNQGWENSQHNRNFKLFFNKREDHQEYFEVYGVVPDVMMNPKFEINEIEKDVVFVKVSHDGTFHYELDTNDIDGNESLKGSEISDKISILSREQEDDNFEIGTNDDDNSKKVHIQEKVTYGRLSNALELSEMQYTSTIQNRPPVIIMNKKICKDIDNASPVFLESSLNDTNVASVVEINTSIDDIIETSMDIDFQNNSIKEELDYLNHTTSGNLLTPSIAATTSSTASTSASANSSGNANNSPNHNSQKQYAQVAPFQLVEKPIKKSPRKLKSPKSPISGKKPDMVSSMIKNCSIKLGPNDTLLNGDIYHAINWSSVREATRKLLTSLFPREILATHTLTGKPSPAFRDRNLPIKRQLDSKIVDDIIYIIMRKCNVDARTVRSIITLKCADENKMLKMRLAKQRKLQGKQNKENLPNNSEDNKQKKQYNI